MKYPPQCDLEELTHEDDSFLASCSIAWRWCRTDAAAAGIDDSAASAIDGHRLLLFPGDQQNTMYDGLMKAICTSTLIDHSANGRSLSQEFLSADFERMTWDWATVPNMLSRTITCQLVELARVVIAGNIWL